MKYATSSFQVHECTLKRKKMLTRSLKQDELEYRDLRDVMDRVMDKGIVLDPADRISMAGEGHLGGDHIVVGSFDTRLDKRVA